MVLDTKFVTQLKFFSPNFPSAYNSVLGLMVQAKHYTSRYVHIIYAHGRRQGKWCAEAWLTPQSSSEETAECVAYKPVAVFLQVV